MNTANWLASTCATIVFALTATSCTTNADLLDTPCGKMPNVKTIQSGTTYEVSLCAKDSPDNTYKSIDLDTGFITQDQTSDFSFGYSTGTMIFYTVAPRNGAKATVVKNDVANVENMCRTQITQMTSGNIPDFDKGTHICVQTNLNQLAEITIKDTSKMKDDIITFSYQLYKP